MKRFTPALIALAAGAATLLSGQPAAAHGQAAGGWAGGLIHPLLGLDHLLMLLAVGAAAALLSSRLLLWAGVGALFGALAGLSGQPLPAAELGASLAVAAMGALILAAVGGHTATVEASRLAPRTTRGEAAAGFQGLKAVGGVLVAAGVALHALLHAQEAPVDASSALWWSGALFSSLLVCGGSYQLFGRLPRSFSGAAAVIFLLAGGALALAPALLPAVGGGAG
ncbi:MAG: hypothetical protein FJ083_04720 [Cyanobacteria bacterium K_Offshore_surface_m2_239]|nr:hypothetical protein [Cyanobacteria bacterium K_Offshore_surface_m2_239]